MIHIIPYKPLSKCSIEELAADRQRIERSGGALFARKDEHDGKDEARAAVLDLLTLAREPGRVSVLSMPGLKWTFEALLLKQRDPNWRFQQSIDSMRLTCVENDRFVYYSACTRVPGLKHCLLRNLPRPEFAERAIGNGMVDRFAFANVDDLMQDPAEVFDFAWLDYTGPLSVPRAKVIQRFWRENVRKTLVVTSLKARWNRETSDTIRRNGGAMQWLRRLLPGNVAHEIEYQDGASPMVQFAVTKTGAAE